MASGRIIVAGLPLDPNSALKLSSPIRSSGRRLRYEGSCSQRRSPRRAGQVSSANFAPRRSLDVSPTAQDPPANWFRANNRALASKIGCIDAV